VSGVIVGGLDPQVVELMDLAASTLPAVDDPSPADRRRMAETVAPLFRGPDPDDDLPPIDVEHGTVVSRDGAPVPTRSYRARTKGSPAVALFIHGGGWVAGSIDSYDVDIRRAVARTGMDAVAVEYRLSPEHRRPAAFEDCMAAARSLLAQGRPLALIGDSAGGHLALECAVALTAEGSRPAGLLVFFPVVDPLAFDNRSYRENGRDYLLTATDMAYYWASYLGPDSSPEAFARASPFAPERLRGLPPTVLATAGFDPLLDENRALAADLIAADVRVDYQPNPALTHGFQQMVPRVDAARRAVDRAYASLRALVEDGLAG
jgi:acetyl esterase